MAGGCSVQLRCRRSHGRRAIAGGASNASLAAIRNRRQKSMQVTPKHEHAANAEMRDGVRHVNDVRVAPALRQIPR